MNYKDIKKVTPFQLEDGMILAEDLYINAIKLLKKDTILNEKNIEKVRALYSNNPVYVYSNIEDYDMEIIKKKNSKEYKEMESNFSQFSDNAETIFNQVMQNSKLDINHIRDLSEDILSIMKNHGIMIHNIVEGGNADSYLFRHSVNVSALSALIGKWLNLSSRDIMLLSYTGILHDIGKSKLPKKLVDKEGALTKDEYELMKTHPIKSYEIVKTIPYIDPAVEIGVLMHHERVDGSGYPLKLNGDRINNYAKIVAIADMFDAITANRPYKKKQCALTALKIMRDDSFGRLDPQYSSIFIKNMLQYYIGEYVLLSDGTKGKILSINENYLDRPLIAQGEDYIDLSIKKDLHIVDIL